MEALTFPFVLAGMLCVFLLCALVLAAVSRTRFAIRPVSSAGSDAPLTLPDHSDRNAQIESALLDFLSRSKASYSVLTILADHKKPVCFKALAAKISSNGAQSEIPLSATRGVLSILQIARLVRMQSAGFSITPMGREVYQRISRKRVPSPQAAMVVPASRCDLSENRRDTRVTLPPDARRVLAELHAKARMLSLQ